MDRLTPRRQRCWRTCFTKQRYGAAHCSADQLEHAVLTSLLDTLVRSDLIEQGLASTTSEIDDQRAAHAAELAALERDITKNEKAIDRYLTELENGTLKEEVCSSQVQKLATTLTEQRARRDEFELLVEGASPPERPDTGAVETMHHDIQVAANTGSTDTLRRVMQTFVHRVTITGRDKVEPTFVIPVIPGAHPNIPQPPHQRRL